MAYTLKNTSSKKTQIAVILAAIVIVVLALIFFRESSSRQLVLQPAGTDAQVFINQQEQSPLAADDSARYDLSRNDNEVLIAGQNTYPWREDVTVANGETAELHPFLIPTQETATTNLASSTQSALTASTTLPTSDEPLVSADESTQLFVDGETNIVAQWIGEDSSRPEFYNCFEGTCGVSVHNNQVITQLAFYPDRNDVLIFATDSAVYAMDIDPNPTQNVQIIADDKTAPQFTIDDGIIYVESTGNITQKNL